MTYGERLRELRAERRLSLRQVEERGGPNKDTMSLIERDIHRPHPQTLGRIAQAFEMSVPDLRTELEAAEKPPLGPAPGGEQRSFDNHIREEQRAAWEAAARNARQLREHGEDRMEALLSSWRDSQDRRALREMGLLLNEAEAARNALMDNTEAGLAMRDPRLESALPGESFPNPGWEEVIAADRLYRSLFDMVLKAELSVRRERKPDREVHEVEEAA